MLKVSAPSRFGQPPIPAPLLGYVCARPPGHGDRCLESRGAACLGEGGAAQMPSVGSSQTSSRYMLKDVGTMSKTGGCRGSFVPTGRG